MDKLANEVQNLVKNNVPTLVSFNNFSLVIKAANKRVN